MATKTGKPVDLSFLGGDVDQALPGGLIADPTYLAFLRGMGFTRKQAWATAVQHIQQARAAYETGVEREPDTLKADQRQTDLGYSAGHNWFSSGRLEDEAQNQREHEQRLADLSTNKATAISGAQQELQSQLGQLGRSNADAIAELQARRDAQLNQDKYTNAVAGANGATAATAGIADPTSIALTKLLLAGPAQPPGTPAPKPAPKPKPVLNSTGGAMGFRKPWGS